MSQCLDVIRSLDSRGRASPLGRPRPVRHPVRHTCVFGANHENLNADRCNAMTVVSGYMRSMRIFTDMRICIPNSMCAPNSVCQTDLARLSLLESYCLPVLQYCTSAVYLNVTQLSELNACWNMVFRKIFGFHK